MCLVSGRELMEGGTSRFGEKYSLPNKSVESTGNNCVPARQSSASSPSLQTPISSGRATMIA